eukprot:m.64588 g.64588  ORF g.64588 m.64588 type:complete len:320 (-) comp13603_c0_seq1:462-1421(-)
MAPVFLDKLYDMTHAAEAYVVWDSTNTKFRVPDVQLFARDVLPRFWKTNSYASFVRQLNLYGFRRTTDNNGQGVMGKVAKEWFHHQHFSRFNRDDLSKIFRKPAVKRNKRKRDTDATGGADAGPKQQSSTLCCASCRGNSGNHPDEVARSEVFMAVKRARDEADKAKREAEMRADNLEQQLAHTQALLREALVRGHLTVQELLPAATVATSAIGSRHRRQREDAVSVECGPSSCGSDRDCSHSSGPFVGTAAIDTSSTPAVDTSSTPPSSPSSPLLNDAAWSDHDMHGAPPPLFCNEPILNSIDFLGADDMNAGVPHVC